MTVRVRSVAVAGFLGVVVATPFVWRWMSVEPELTVVVTPIAPADDAGDDVARVVRVEHEFVTLPAAVRGESVRPSASVAPAETKRARRPVAEPVTLAQKTRRALLGDGRYRPEPFPRAR